MQKKKKKTEKTSPKAHVLTLIKYDTKCCFSYTRMATKIFQQITEKKGDKMVFESNIFQFVLFLAPRGCNNIVKCCILQLFFILSINCVLCLTINTVHSCIVSDNIFYFVIFFFFLIKREGFLKPKIFCKMKVILL